MSVYGLRICNVGGKGHRGRVICAQLISDTGLIRKPWTSQPCNRYLKHFCHWFNCLSKDTHTPIVPMGKIWDGLIKLINLFTLWCLFCTVKNHKCCFVVFSQFPLESVGKF